MMEAEIVQNRCDRIQIEVNCKMKEKQKLEITSYVLYINLPIIILFISPMTNL